MPTLILNREEVLELLDIKEIIAAIEQAFKDWARGAGGMPPKSYLPLEKGDFRAMPAALPGAAGMKWVNVHPRNPARGLPTVMAVIVYNDPDTGYPLAVMAAADITAYRTGTTAAIASKCLARRDSATLGVIGAGRQAYSQIRAHTQIFDLRQVRVFDLSHEVAQRLIAAFPDLPLRECSLEETAGSDIVCTLTPSREPYLKRDWIAPGAHINAIGADAEGKEELDPAILKEAMVVVDDARQARLAGEINVPISKGLYSADEIYGSLGEIVAGMKPGRKDHNTITVFDSTGVAIEDVAVAKLLYGKAAGRKRYLSVDMVGESPRR
jgi:alanine dehydrogenase